MIKNQKLSTEEGVQVALFPLHSFIITQRDDESYSHNPSAYLASDYQAYNYSGGGVIRFCEYYAPCDIICVGMDKTNASICWRSKNKVLLANGDIDYLIILCYHDNDIPKGKFKVGDTRNQGDIMGHTGTYGNGGSSVANHLHLETGYGENWSKVYANPYWGHINKAYALHNYNALWGNETICYGITSYPDKYSFKNYEGGIIDPPTPPPIIDDDFNITATKIKSKNKFNFLLTSRKRKLKKNF